MRIRDVMNEDVACCSVDDSCQEAARAMRDLNVGFVVVREPKGGKVAGVVTDRDICMAAAARLKVLSDIPIKTTMSKKVFSCRLDSDLTSAHLAMRKHHVRRLPVVDTDGVLAGVVSLSDLAREAYEVAPFTTSPDVASTLAQLSERREATAGLRKRL